MELAIVAADYTPGEADELRRSMAAWKRQRRPGTPPRAADPGHARQGLRGRLRSAHLRADQRLRQLRFPESHAASFALLTYASSWLKRHEPAAFACALINSWPMGFYSPDQLLQDARRHTLQTRPVDVRHSGWDCSLESFGQAQPAIRLGLRMIRGFREEDARRIEQVREAEPFLDARSRRRARPRRPGPGVAGRCRAPCAVSPDTGTGALGRRQRRAAIAAVRRRDRHRRARSACHCLARRGTAERLRLLGTTLGPHPLKLLRGQLKARRRRDPANWRNWDMGDRYGSPAWWSAGSAHRPPAASPSSPWKTSSACSTWWSDTTLPNGRGGHSSKSRLLQVEGILESSGEVRHVIAGRLHDPTLYHRPGRPQPGFPLRQRQLERRAAWDGQQGWPRRGALKIPFIHTVNQAIPFIGSHLCLSPRSEALTRGSGSVRRTQERQRHADPPGLSLR